MLYKLHEKNTTELAEMFFISRAKLMNDFKQVTGDTLANYILKIRL